ncbi:MAG: C69 family dipeptidase [Flavonifractor sp.]|nr:C69 family dipeptidase [Flavonifractor sp.]
MKKTLRILSVLLAGTMLLSTSALACTGVYVGKDVSDQGTYLLARSEDQGQSDYNKMFLVQPRVDNVPGRFIEDTATGFKIPLPDTTWQYTYVPDYTRGDDGMYPGSCTNEHGVSITGTVSTSTCEKWEEADPFIEPGLREAILPAAVAAVATSARNAVDVLLGYVDEYGSEEGNTVMICDQNEAWFVEIYSGHHYCAMKMPDDQVAVFGNHNMIGLVDPKATPEDGYIYSEGLFELIDELDLAVKEGELYHLAKSVTENTREPYNNMRNWGGMKLLAPSLAGDTYDNDNFYPLFYAPDEKVSVLDVMDIYRYRYEGTPIDVNLEGQEGNRVISTTNSSQIHILQTFSDWPAQCSAINWIALGNGEHTVFVPFFSGITDTAEAYKVDGDTYNPQGAYWMFKRLCTLGQLDRDLYGNGVRAFWKQQEALMYQQMLDAAPTMLAKYAESREAGAAYVTGLGIQMSEWEMKLSNNLYQKLLTCVTHNINRRADRIETFLPDVPLRQIAESKGYTVTWNAADGSTTITKGAASYTITPEEYTCKVAGGEDIELTHYAYVNDGVTYIPMDFADTL